MAKKVTAKMLKNIMDTNNTVTEQITDKNGKIYDLSIKRRLTLPEALSFVADVCSLCFDQETMEFSPELREVGIRIHTLIYFTNLTATENDTETLYALAYDPQIAFLLQENIDQCFYHDLIAMCDHRLDYYAELSTSVYARGMMDLVSTANKLHEDMENATAQIQSPEFTRALNKLNLQAPDADNGFKKVK